MGILATLRSSLPWNRIRSTPTTRDGYGITDVYLKTDVDTAIANAIAGVNPAVAVEAATAAVLPNTPSYTHVAGIGDFLTATAALAALTVDGYAVSAGDRILVKDQAAALRNGVYTVTTVGTGLIPWVLTRALDFDAPSDMNDTGAIPVVNGTVNAGTQWLLTSKVVIVGTDAVTFTQFSPALASIVTLTGAQALTNKTTTTQAPLDNSTKLATTAYADAAVAAGGGGGTSLGVIITLSGVSY